MLSENKELKEVIEDVSKWRDEHKYQMLGRFIEDCEFFINHGNRYEKHLWAGNVKDHINYMKEVYNSVPKKPEWLSLEEIERYEILMNNTDFDIVIKLHDFQFGIGTIWLTEEDKKPWRLQTYQSRFGMLEVLEEKYMEEFLENSKSNVTELSVFGYAFDDFKSYWNIKGEKLIKTKIVKNIEEASEYLKDKEVNEVVLIQL